ncbi:MAG: ATP-binding protein [Spirosomataceae bacterium]
MEIIVGRQKQINQLEEAFASNKPEMLAVIGRRRVGKTFLIRNVYEKRLSFELTGVQYATQKEQLQIFSVELSKYFPAYPLPKKPESWLEAFFMLSQAIEKQELKKKTVVFFDELPWLGTKRSDFLKGLSWFWNSWATRQKIVVVICGSAASWMIGKVINDRGGLHNRVTKLIYLYPFTLAETEAFLVSRNVKLSRYQIVQIYMAMGGIPMYLDQVKAGLSAVQNIQKICFEPDGYLRKEFDRLFASLFDNYQNHMEIIRALANRKIGLTRNQLIEATKFTNGGMLSALLEDLSQSGFIGVYSSHGKKKRESLYRITDSYSLFYLNFLEAVGENTNADFNRLSELPKWKAWSGYAYENVCLYHIDQIRESLSIRGVYSTVSSFFALPKDGLPGAQIDLVIDRNDNSINICEIKFCEEEYTVTKKDIENIGLKKQVFRYHTKTKKHLFTTLITTFGAINNAHKINNIDQVITLEGLFR